MRKKQLTRKKKEEEIEAEESEENAEERENKVKKLPKLPQIGGKRLSTLIEMKEIREALKF